MREIYIRTGYVVQTKHSLLVFHNLRELTREVCMCRKTLYTAFKQGRWHLDDFIEGIFKLENGEIVKQILNTNIHGNTKKYFEVVEYGIC